MIATNSIVTPAWEKMMRYLPRHRHLIQLENVFLSLLLAVMVLLPLVEIVLRKLLRFGIEGNSAIVQHITLAVSILGAAVAARENRLLSLSMASLFEGRIDRYARLFSASISTTIVSLLCFASIRFVEAEQMGQQLLAYGLPVWVVQLVLPIGFGLIALRLVAHASPHFGDRALVALSATTLIVAVTMAPWDPDTLVVPGLIILLAATILGAPIFVALGGAALILLWGEGVPIASLAVDHYALAANPSLPTIPLFTLAGYLFAESSAPQRLIAVFKALFGRLHGGAAIVTVLVCTFFTAFTGASGVTILALGGLVMPLLLASGSDEKHALGLVTGGGSAGVILMPALPLILYAIVARVDLEAMFLAGVLPALLFLGITIGWALRQQRPQLKPAARFDYLKTRNALLNAKWELALPLVPILSIFTGLATPVEAAAATAFYAFFVVTVVHGDLKLHRDLPRVFSECGLLVGGILLILGVALGFTNYLVDAEIPDWIFNRVTQTIESPWVFLLALNGVLLVVGCLMDIFSAIVVLAPLIVPIGVAFGVHPVHLGIIFLANLELGYLTPPIGMNLFFASYRFDKSIVEVYRAVFPLFLVLCAGVLLITYVPFLSTALPGFLR